MEIDITAFATEGEMFEFSGSIAERGQNAANETWNNSKAEAAERPLLNDAQLPEFRDYIRGFGAWEDEIIDAWNATECNALFIQLVAGDMREAKSLCPGNGPGGIDWDAYHKLAEAGTCSGRLHPSDNDHVYYYVGD